MNSQAISTADVLSQNIFNRVPDPIDAELNRSSKRILGTILGLPLFGLGVPFVLDIDCDFKKMKRLAERTDYLQSMPLNSKEANFEKAQAAVEFQSKVNQNIIDYTKNASTIKTIAAALFFIQYGAGVAFNTIPQHEENQAALILALLISGGAFYTGVGASVVALGHRAIAGQALQEKNQQLAEQYLQVK